MPTFQSAAERDNYFLKLIKWAASGLVLAIVLTMASCSSFYTVEQGERGMHTRMGALADVTGPGFHLKAPFIDGVKRLSVRNQTLNWQAGKEGDSRMETYSKDQQPAHIAVTVTWSPLADEKSMTGTFSTFGSIEGLQSAVIVPKATEAVKNVFGTYDAVTVIQNRAKFNADVALEMQRLIVGYPVALNGVQIQDISFSNEYEAAVEARMMAQVEVQKREQQKQTTQIDADMRVIQAEADAKQTKLAGEAAAAIVEVRGKAEAAAIRARADALASNAKLVDLTAVEKWDGHLPTTMVPGSAVPFLKIGANGRAE